MGFDVLGGGGAGGGGGTGGGVVVNIGGNTTGTTANINSGTFVLAGGNNVTLSQQANSITISAGGGTASFWHPPFPGTPTPTSTYGQSSMYFFQQNIPMYMSVSAVNVPISVSVSTSSNSSHGGTLSFGVGLYTRNASTLSAATTGSVSFAWTDTSGQSSSVLTGLRYFTIPFAANITPGDYWIGLLSQTATVNANWITISNHLHNNVATGPVGPFLSTTANSNNFIIGEGHMSAQTAALPTSVPITGISGTGSKDHMGPVLYFMNVTV